MSQNYDMVGLVIAVRNQSRCEFNLHANSIRTTEPSVGSHRHPDRLGDHHLDVGGNLEAFQMGRRGTGALLRLGFACFRSSIVDHLDEFVSNHVHPS